MWVGLLSKQLLWQVCRGYQFHHTVFFRRGQVVGAAPGFCSGVEVSLPEIVAMDGLAEGLAVDGGMGGVVGRKPGKGDRDVGRAALDFELGFSVVSADEEPGMPVEEGAGLEIHVDVVANRLAVNHLPSVAVLCKGFPEGLVRAVVVFCGLWEDKVFDHGFDKVPGFQAGQSGGRQEVESG